MSPTGRFSTGIEQMPAHPANHREGTFADGLARHTAGVPVRGRFSRGIEADPDGPQNGRVGSFADGAAGQLAARPQSPRRQPSVERDPYRRPLPTPG